MIFEPKVLSFLCNWCAYAGADLAGISRFQYPPNSRVIRVMCSGRVDPSFVPRAFLVGYDGVMILGCHPGDCHYLTGNYQAEKKIILTRKLLEMAGIGSDRLLLDWVSAGEGERFSQVIRQFVEKIRGLGPFPLDQGMRGRLQAVKASLEGEKIRWMVGKGPELIEKENVYHEQLPKERLDAAIETTIRDELIKNRIIALVESKTLAAAEISQTLNLKLKETLDYLVSLIGEGKIGFDPSEEGKIPKYIRNI
ncbi:MAG: hydrogenase iron-sulfur subunit [Thermodesulfobacteriota bacterium]|nr:hydrogenase iron-sulfur subunit [Thermodesulfobacteriota bacterium]